MRKTWIINLLFLLVASVAFAEAPAFTATNPPNDDGSEIGLAWDLPESSVDSIRIERKTPGEDYRYLLTVEGNRGEVADGDAVVPGIPYTYRLSFFTADSLIGTRTTIGQSKAEWYHRGKTPVMVGILVLSGAIIWYIRSARKGRDLFIRRISGLDSMEESVGRASEMGKPIVFVPGINDIDDMQTIAALTILGKLAEKTAEYDTRLVVPVCRSMALVTAREIVKESHLKAGRPDSYRPDSIFYLTDDQFGYVAGVDGIIMREKPAAIFLLGTFYAESLILAETGFASGAIQTSGTAMQSQIPFFVAACDYTLIGEELFAASAYLSKDPYEVGCLKGQDLGKIIIVVVMLIGILCEMVGFQGFREFISLSE